MGALEPGDAVRARLREAVVREHMRDAWRIVVLYNAHGEMREDGLQVAYRGLAAAVDGFDPGSGAGFLAYAVPVIVQQARVAHRETCVDTWPARHGWESADAVEEAVGRLARESGRSPTVPQVARALGTTAEWIVESLDAAPGHGASQAGPSLRAAGSAAAPAGGLVRFDAAMSRETIRSRFRALAWRHKQVLLMRALRAMSDAQIAVELGIPRVQVSGLLAESPGGRSAGTPSS